MVEAISTTGCERGVQNILRKRTAGYKIRKSQEKINYLMYVDDIKPFAKNEKEFETLEQTARINS